MVIQQYVLFFHLNKYSEFAIKTFRRWRQNIKITIFDKIIFKIVIWNLHCYITLYLKETLKEEKISFFSSEICWLKLCQCDFGKVGDLENMLKTVNVTKQNCFKCKIGIEFGFVQISYLKSNAQYGRKFNLLKQRHDKTNIVFCGYKI